MTVQWITPAGSLGKVTERIILNITLLATSDVGPVTFSIIAGTLPRGLRLSNGSIKGSPTEVRKYTESRFVVRASDGVDIEDRTFSMAVDGSDSPEWITAEGFLNVGQGENYFVLDNEWVDFQLLSSDPDLIAGDTLSYYLAPSGGELPPGLTLSKEGRIYGFTDPVFAVDISFGGYDTVAFDDNFFDKAETKSNGFDSYLYDLPGFDYSEPSQQPRKLSRFYTFVVVLTDGINETRRLFRIWVVTDDFLKADNTIQQVDTNLFRADNTSNRFPIWITESNLGIHRANNYLTIFLDVYDPPSLSGTIVYLLLNKNPDNSDSVLPPGMSLDTITGEIAGRVPYQARVSKTYTFTMQALDYPASLANINYVIQGDWSNNTPYLENQAVRYNGLVYIAIKNNINQLPTTVDSLYWHSTTASAEKTFTIEIIGEIDSAIEWVTDTDLGTIKPNQASIKSVEATGLIGSGHITYQIESGELPPGLTLLGTGDIVGKVQQFADDTGPGLTRYYEKLDSTTDESTLSRNYLVSFDESLTTFDKKFVFRIKARDSSNFVELTKEFFITVIADNTKTFANLYFKAFQNKEKRLAWYDFITNTEIFRPSTIYRYGDTNFGIQSEIKVLIYAGIESVEAVSYVQAMSKNHYRKQLRFGDIKSAEAKDPVTQETLYEVIYAEIVDNYQDGNTSISSMIELPNDINSKVLTSYDSIKVDSNIPIASDSDHQRIFPNSIKNMRRNIRNVGDRDRSFLPLWMRSIQDQAFVETGYLSAMVICYVTPGESVKMISRIKSNTQRASRGSWDRHTSYMYGDSVLYEGSVYTSAMSNINKNPRMESNTWIKNFDFKSIDFTVDRYLIDVLDGQIENKYLAFPQRGEKLP